MDAQIEANEPVTEAKKDSSSSPLDLSTKKRKFSDSETAEEYGDDGPETAGADVWPTTEEDPKPTPLDLSRDRSAPSDAATGDIKINVIRPSVVVRSPMVVRSPVAVCAPMPKEGRKSPVAAVATVAAVSPAAVSAAAVAAMSPAAAKSPPILARAHSPIRSAATYDHMFSAKFNPFLAAAAAAAAAEPPVPSATQFHHHHHHHQQQQQQLYLQQQHQLHVQHQQQIQLQIQLQQQQQQLAAYGGGHHAYDLFNPMMMTHKMAASPLYDVSTSSPSSSESNQFPFGGFDYFPKSGYGFGYPYFDEIIGGKGSIGYGLDSSSAGDRSDCMSPELPTSTEHVVHHHKRKMCSFDDPDVNPEEIAAIYRQSDFVSFRHRYLESLGPPKNFEKMRRSGSSKILQMNGQHPYDQTYVMKRQKNNEAAKRSRDAKRQKYIENQISVMYLTKKVSEMKEIKRRLLMSM